MKTKILPENKVKSLGFIVSIYRKKQGLSLYKFATLSKISIRYLREIEDGRKEPSLQDLDSLFQAMKSEKNERNKNTEEIQLLLHNLFRNIIFVNRQDRKSTFEELVKKEKQASLCLIYPEYLLALFAYNATISNDIEAQRIHDIIDIEGLFFEESLQLFFLYKGVLLKQKGDLDQALFYYIEALRLSGNESILGMLHYHLAIVYTKQLREIRAYEHNMKAKEYFSRTNNTIRELIIVNHIGIIYSHYREFELAEANFLHLYKQASLLGLDKEIYNASHNLTRLYVLWHKEKIAIEYAEKTINSTFCEPEIFYYASWAHFKLGNKIEAKKWLDDVNRLISEDNQLANAFSRYMECLLNLNTLSEVECLLEINQLSIQLADYNDRLIFKKMLAEAATKVNDKELELKCYKEIIEMTSFIKA